MRHGFGGRVRRVLGAVAPAGLAIAMVLPVTPATAATPNTSVFMAGGATKAETGVLTATGYTRKRTLSLSGVTAAAATRSSLALYSKGSGKLRTGTFRGGVYTPVETITVRSGFTAAVGSCDSLLLYNRLTGRAMSGTLIGGRFRNRTTFFLPAGFTELAASCDTTFFNGPNDLAVPPKGLAGSLSGGDWTQGSFQYTNISTKVGMNSSTYVLSNGTFYQWGAAQGGAVNGTGNATICDGLRPRQRCRGHHALVRVRGQRVPPADRRRRGRAAGCARAPVPSGRTIIAGGR